MFSFPFRFFVSFLYVFRVHKSECKKNVKHFKTKNSLKYKKKKKELGVNANFYRRHFFVSYRLFQFCACHICVQRVTPLRDNL